MPEQQTGNPVFDYRAPFRAAANTLQRFLFLGGLALFVTGGIVFLIGDALRLAAALVALAGIAFCLFGVVWGFNWRNKLRAEFRNLYGPPQ